MTRHLSAPARRPDGAALIVALGLLGLGAVLIWQAGSLPDKGGYAGIGSDAAPRFVGYGLWALALGHVIRAFRVGGEGIFLAPVPVLWVVLGLGLQVMLLKPAGFAVASGLLFACTAAGFGRRRLWVTLPIGVGLALGIYGVFDQLLRLKLPAGPLENLIFGG